MIKKPWHFLSVITVLLVILTTVIGAATNASAATICSPATAISVPFTYDGPGDYCYQTSSLCTYINSWNMTALEINGIGYTNTYAASSSITPLNGKYTIHYNSVGAYGHFEIAGSPCAGAATPTKTPVVLTPTRTSTQGIVLTPTRTLTPAGDLGYGSVSGKVKDAVTGASIAGVLITCTHGSIFTPVEEHCVGTTTTGADGTYRFSNIHIYATDTITVRADVAGYDSQWYVSQTTFTSANPVVNFALSRVAPTPTRTRTPTPGPSLTPTITLTRTITPTVTPTLPGGICAPVEATLTAPFDFTGAGTHCWRISTLGGITSNNLTALTVNGVSFLNLFVAPSGLPPQVGGYWYISYVSSFTWGHLQIFQ